MSIEQDNNRFRDIVKGRIKEDLKKFISHEELIGKSEKDIIKIPIPYIDIPNFRFGKKNDETGIGQGEGEEGDEAGQGQGAGENPGEHTFEAQLTMEEMGQILGEALELPKIEPKGNKNIETLKKKYNLLAPVGPQGLKHFKSSYKKALRRSISSGVYSPENPVVIPVKEDLRYKSYKEVKKPQSKAVIFYLMDVSGSMGEEEKTVVQLETFWINAWIKKHYKNLQTHFIVHDAKAEEVKEKEFFSITASGGTMISSAYKLCQKMIEEKYPLDEWNIYVFHFSDGDNWSEEDSRVSIKLIKDYFSKVANSFNYGQVASSHGSGNFYHILEKEVSRLDNVILSKIKGREDILNSIKTFLGKGK